MTYLHGLTVALGTVWLNLALLNIHHRFLTDIRNCLPGVTKQWGSVGFTWYVLVESV